MKRLWPLALLLVGCSGGLNLDQGNTFPCDFNVGEGVRDKACPSGWICGVANVCQQKAEEGIPADLPAPQLQTPTRLLPTYLSQPIDRIAGDSTNTRFLVGTAAGTMVIDDLQTLTANGAPNGPPLLEPLLASAAFSPAPDGGAVALMIAADTSTTRFDFPPQGTVPSFGPPSSTPFSGGTASALATLALDPLHASPIVYRGEDGGLHTVDYSTGTETFADLPANTGAVNVFAPLPDGFAYSTLTFETDGSKFSHTGALRDFDFASNPSTPLWMDVANPVGPNAASLRTSRDGRAIAALTYNALIDARIPFSLEVWNADIDVVPTLSKAFGGCTPCPNGNVIGFQPISTGGTSVEVICEDFSTGLRSLLQVNGSNGAGGCESTPLTASFDLSELSTIDGTNTGSLVAGGKHGEIWVGDRFSALEPVFLDRPATAVGVVRAQAFDGGISFAPVLFTADRLFVPGSNDGFVNVGVVDPATAAATYLVPSQWVNGALNWFVNRSAGITFIDPTVQRGPHPLVMVGPQMVSPTGEPASPPYNATSTTFTLTLPQATADGGVVLVPAAPLGTFILTAFDSLYTWDVDPTQMLEVPSVNPLLPKLTPEPGFPIHSLAIGPSPDAGVAIGGYVATSNAVFSVALGGSPPRWSATQIVLPSDEPVSVWMSAVNSPLGRVGYRDGSIYTLPGAFPLTHPLPPASGGKTDRVLEYVNLFGWPVAHSESGIFIANKRTQGSDILDWAPLLSATELAQLEGLGTNYHLFVDQPEGALILFGDHGYTYRIDVKGVQLLTF